MKTNDNATNELSRRTLLRGLLASGAVLLGAKAADAAGGSARCVATSDDIEGPYYLPGAPVRSSLLEPGMEGLALELQGQVTNTHCEPLRGARLEFWQCDARGRYDVRGMRLRAALETDREGRFGLQTILPGRYLNGAQYRPAHLHLKVHARGRILTTQLYFQGDPYNAADPWFRAERALRLEQASAGYHARFDPTLPVR